MADLRMLGVQVALDGFGQGPAGMRVLWEMQFDKIRFSAAAFDTARLTPDLARSALNSLIGFCHDLGTRVAVSDVDTERRVVAAAGLRWDEVQGRKAWQLVYGQPDAVGQDRVTTR